MPPGARLCVDNWVMPWRERPHGHTRKTLDGMPSVLPRHATAYSAPRTSTSTAASFATRRLHRNTVAARHIPSTRLRPAGGTVAPAEQTAADGRRRQQRRRADAKV
jgi:hypothetical protein